MREVEGLDTLATKYSQIIWGGFGVAYFALGQLRLDSRPSLTLSGIAQKIHNDSPLGYRFIHFEEVGTWNPAVLLSLFPRLPILSYSNNDI